MPYLPRRSIATCQYRAAQTPGRFFAALSLCRTSTLSLENSFGIAIAFSCREVLVSNDNSIRCTLSTDTAQEFPGYARIPRAWILKRPLLDEVWPNRAVVSLHEQEQNSIARAKRRNTLGCKTWLLVYPSDPSFPRPGGRWRFKVDFFMFFDSVEIPVKRSTEDFNCYIASIPPPSFG